MLGLGNIELLNFALSDAEKTTTMVIPTYRWGTECWYDARVKTEKANPAWREIHVTSERLDHFFDKRGSAPPSPSSNAMPTITNSRFCCEGACGLFGPRVLRC